MGELRSVDALFGALLIENMLLSLMILYNADAVSSFQFVILGGMGLLAVIYGLYKTAAMELDIGGALRGLRS